MDHLRVDVEQVDDVVAFYRRAALVVGAASADLAAPGFGAWSSSVTAATEGQVTAETADHLAARYAQMTARLSARLAAQARAADVLAARLGAGAAELGAQDTKVAEMLGRADS